MSNKAVDRQKTWISFQAPLNLQIISRMEGKDFSWAEILKESDYNHFSQKYPSIYTNHWLNNVEKFKELQVKTRFLGKHFKISDVSHILVADLVEEKRLSCKTLFSFSCIKNLAYFWIISYDSSETYDAWRGLTRIVLTYKKLTRAALSRKTLQTRLILDESCEVLARHAFFLNWGR